MQNYKRKVSGKTYLFGSTGITKEIETELYLSIRVDEMGEKVQIGVTKKNASTHDTPYGELNPGESFLFALKGLIGVYAQPDQGKDSNIYCSIING